MKRSLALLTQDKITMSSTQPDTTGEQMKKNNMNIVIIVVISIALVVLLMGTVCALRFRLKIKQYFQPQSLPSKPALYEASVVNHYDKGILYKNKVVDESGKSMEKNTAVDENGYLIPTNLNKQQESKAVDDIGYLIPINLNQTYDEIHLDEDAYVVDNWGNLKHTFLTQ